MRGCVGLGTLRKPRAGRYRLRINFAHGTVIITVHAHFRSPIVIHARTQNHTWQWAVTHKMRFTQDLIPSSVAHRQLDDRAVRQGDFPHEFGVWVRVNSLRRRPVALSVNIHRWTMRRFAWTENFSTNHCLAQGCVVHRTARGSRNWGPLRHPRSLKKQNINKNNKKRKKKNNNSNNSNNQISIAPYASYRGEEKGEQEEEEKTERTKILSSYNLFHWPLRFFTSTDLQNCETSGHICK